MNLHTYCINQSIEFFIVLGKPQKKSIIWQLKSGGKSQGRDKLNTDGASLGNLGRVGGGGVIRDHRGMWIKGFAQKIGHATSLLAEL